MERHLEDKVVTAYAGTFQPGDATSYAFIATVRSTTDGDWAFGGGRYMQSYEFQVRSMIECYERNLNAIGEWGNAESREAMDDFFVEYVSDHTASRLATAWAFVQWFVEQYTGVEPGTKAWEKRWTKKQ